MFQTMRFQKRINGASEMAHWVRTLWLQRTQAQWQLSAICQPSSEDLMPSSDL